MVGKDKWYISTRTFILRKQNFQIPIYQCGNTAFLQFLTGNSRKSCTNPLALQKRPEQSTADTLARLGVFPVGTELSVNSLSCFPLVNTYAWPFAGAVMQYHHYCFVHVSKADLVPKAADSRPFSRHSSVNQKFAAFFQRSYPSASHLLFF